MKKSDVINAKWFPLFVLAVIFLIIYMAVDNIGMIAETVGRFLWVISPLLFGVLFAYFLYIPCKLIENLFQKTNRKFLVKRSRGLSVLTIFFLLVFLIVMVFSYVVPILIQSLIDLTESIPGFIAEIAGLLDAIGEDSFLYGFDIAGALQDYLYNTLATVINIELVEQLAGGIISIIATIVNIGLGLIISLYMILERDRIHAFFRSLNRKLFSRKKIRVGMEKYLGQVNKVLFTFIASKGLDSIINLVTVTTILMIFGIPYAFLLGMIAGILNFIPYIGSLIAVLLISVITLLTGGIAQAVQVLIPLLIFQQLDGNYIEPRIMKSSLKMSPILVIISVLIGGAYFGFVGMFLAVPIATIIKQILIEYTGTSNYERESSNSSAPGTVTSPSEAKPDA